MPFRGYRRRKPYMGRKKNFRKKSGWQNLARKAFKTAKFVASLVNSEYKQYDINTTAADHTYNGTIINLCTPSQGSAVNNRTGDSIKMKNLTFRGEALKNATEELLRVIIFIDRQNTITNGSDLLQSVGNTNAVFSPKKDDNKFDTKVLKDSLYKVTTDSPMTRIEFVLKINEHLHFNTGVSTVDKNALKMAVFSQSNVNGAKLASYTRVTYLDN